MADTSRKIRAAFCAVFDDLSRVWLGRLLSAVVSRRRVREFDTASDGMDANVARYRSMLQPGPARDRLTHSRFVSQSAEDSAATLEAALKAVILSEPMRRGCMAQWEATVHAGDDARLVQRALAAELIRQPKRRSWSGQRNCGAPSSWRTAFRATSSARRFTAPRRP